MSIEITDKSFNFFYETVFVFFGPFNIKPGLNTNHFSKLMKYRKKTIHFQQLT